jgi:hypothetical protein
MLAARGGGGERGGGGGGGVPGVPKKPDSQHCRTATGAGCPPPRPSVLGTARDD